MSSDILNKIVARKQERLRAAENKTSLPELRKQLEREKPERRPWPLARNRFDLIAEVKKASPSLGEIKWVCSLPELVQGYKQGGAGVISVLTEEDFFRGSLQDLAEVRRLSGLPVLRKDFLWTEYQLVESRLHGADAILLIVALLPEENLKNLLVLARELELETLVECHDRQEVELALRAGAKTIGINNRNLRTFEVKLETTLELVKLIPNDCIVVSESGIRKPEDAGKVAAAGANAVLVGESCVRQADPARHIASLLDMGRKERPGSGERMNIE